MGFSRKQRRIKTPRKRVSQKVADDRVVFALMEYAWAGMQVLRKQHGWDEKQLNEWFKDVNTQADYNRKHPDPGFSDFAIRQGLLPRESKPDK